MKRLVEYARVGGCAGKACQEDLFKILSGLPRFAHPDLLVTGDTADDAGVFRIDSERALVLTVDVLTPIADDPYIFGQIAAANSLSDVYAMGAEPVAALAVLGVPIGEIEHHRVQKIVLGAWDKVKEAGAVVVGGHTTRDLELKFGLAVSGMVHPEKIITNAGAQPGDVLVLTKPLGTGIVTTALRTNQAPVEMITAVNRLMTQLNREAGTAMREVGVNAATDITGFGLLGHTWEIAQASQVDLVIEWQKVPFLPGVYQLAKQRLFPGGTINNYQFIQPRADFSPDVDEATQLLLCDAQTSGGLLISVPEDRVESLVKQLSEWWIIGYAQKGVGRLVVN